jgi:hypothetical protein
MMQQTTDLRKVSGVISFPGGLGHPVIEIATRQGF